MENLQPNILLKTKNGRYIEVVENELVVGETVATPACIFKVVNTHGATIALKSSANGNFASCSEGGIKADVPQVIEGSSVFEPVYMENGFVALKASNGKFLTGDSKTCRLEAESDEVGVHEMFYMESAAGMMNSLIDNKPYHQAGVLWDDKLHAKLLELACRIISMLKDSIPGAEKLLNFVREYEKSIRDGIHDADYIPPFCDLPDEHSPTPLYRNHFYNPRTEANYLGNKLFTAKNECLEFFEIAAQYKDPEKKAYNLGLAFHFLCDLTMPMHTANCIENGTGIHTGYEKLADAYYELFVGNLGELAVGDIMPNQPLENFLRYDVAETSFKIFFEFVLPYIPGPGAGWTLERAQYSFRELFGKDAVKYKGCYALKKAAAFLLYMRGLV